MENNIYIKNNNIKDIYIYIYNYTNENESAPEYLNLKYTLKSYFLYVHNIYDQPIKIYVV